MQAAEPAPADEADGAQYGSDFVAPHPGMKIATSNMVTGAMPADLAAVMSNPVYVPDYLETVTPKHVEPKQASRSGMLWVHVFDTCQVLWVCMMHTFTLGLAHQMSSMSQLLILVFGAHCALR